MGAVVGALYAAGHTPEKIKRSFLGIQFTRSSVFPGKRLDC